MNASAELLTLRAWSITTMSRPVSDRCALPGAGRVVLQLVFNSGHVENFRMHSAATARRLRDSFKIDPGFAHERAL